MAVMFSMEFTGVGADKYDAVMKELGLDKKGAKWPKGYLSHVAGKSPDGMSVVDVWESEAAFAKFREKQLMPAFEKVGGLPEPRVVVSKVVNRKTIKP